MKSPKETPKKLPKLPRTETYRSGSYRLFDGPDNAVKVTHKYRTQGDGSDFSNTDWALLLVDAGWEKAHEAYYQGLDEGYRMGQAAGLIEGSQEGKCNAEKAEAAFEQALFALEKNLLQFYVGVERWSVKLALHIAEKVVESVANEHKDLVKQTVRKAIAETADKTRILIRVNPSDFQALKDFRADIREISEGTEHFKIEVDTSITPGSCRVETPSGLVDADFMTQLGELRRALILHEEAVE